MKTVWKFNLPRHPGVYDTPMDASGKILCVAVQRGHPVVYAEVDAAALVVRRRVQLVMTGEQVPRTGRYVGTLMLLNDTFVLHAYEVFP